ncbi:MAG: ATP-dependent helicase [Candidatus Altiarchaeota archaeon]
MISHQTKPYSDEEIFQEMHPLVREWFQKKFKEFALPQKFAILNIHRRENTLVSAPTGSGKTLTAFLSIINELVKLSGNNNLEDKVYCVYVSPLKALNNDIEKNLNSPLKEIENLAGKNLGIRVMVRTGDTSTSTKARMLSKPPHILITTPETLAIILNAPKFRKFLKDVKWVIVDEIHSLAENKRGVHLTLSLERLQNLAGRFTRIGLSATISPLEEVAKFLVGYENSELRDCKVVDVQFIKKLDMKVLTPVPNLMKTTQKELHDSLYNLLYELISQHKTTLIFTNTRSGTERVIHNLKEKFPKEYNEATIGAHHSSLSKGHRLDIENRLKNGELRCVVSSTSLELGIDIGYIDLVILLGSPKSVARALQRVGRSGHKLHDTAKGRIIVLDRDDLIECSVLLKNALEGKIDKVHIPKNCLDVLAQHLYGIAIEEKQNIDNIYALIRRSYCYKDLEFSDYEAVLDYLSGKYVELEQRNVYAKIWIDKEARTFGRRSKLARVLYSTNVGTIPDESYITVKKQDIKVGTIEEDFLERLKKGDIFVLGGRCYKFLYSRGQTAHVMPYEGVPTVPSWFSEQLPLSFDLAIEIGKFRKLIEEKLEKNEKKEQIVNFILKYLYVDKNSANSIFEYIREQFLYAKIPTDKKIVIEFYQGFKRKYVIFHTIYGRRVNDALSRAIAYLISKRQQRDVMVSLSDNGFYLYSSKGEIQVLQAIEDLKKFSLKEIATKAIEKTEVLERRFRHCATRALMILRSYKGKRKSVGKQQVGSKMLLNFIRKFQEEFPILKEARREVLEDLMDIENAEKIAEMIKKGEIKIETISTDIPSPFALNLIAQGYMDVIKMEDRLEFIRRMHEAVLKRIESRQDF